MIGIAVNMAAGDVDDGLEFLNLNTTDTLGGIILYFQGLSCAL